MNRRAFLNAGLSAGATALLSDLIQGEEQPRPPAGTRYLSINSMIRKYQVEASRTKHMLADETELHSAEGVVALSNAVRRGFRDAKITWAMSWCAITDPSPRYEAIRKTVKELHQQFGDDVAFAPGTYFANAYNSREQVNRDNEEAAAIIERFMGGYRPRSIIAGFMAAENIRYARQKLGIQAIQGNIWSQFSVDFQDGDGSIAYPYYPSTRHFCKPAQGDADLIDCPNLDGWTVDLVAARLVGVTNKGCVQLNSRLGVGPIETLQTFGIETGLKQMQATTAAHFCDENIRRNPFGWITNNYEISEMQRTRSKGTLDGFGEWVGWIKRTWPDAQCPTIAELGDRVREVGPNNDSLKYILHQEGSGIGGSVAGLAVTWFMNKHFRLGLLHQDGKPQVMDFTDYTKDYAEPKGEGQRNWSILGEINQKGTRPQDKPIPLKEWPRWSEMLQRLTAIYPNRNEWQRFVESA